MKTVVCLPHESKWSVVNAIRIWVMSFQMVPSRPGYAIALIQCRLILWEKKQKRSREAPFLCMVCAEEIN